MTVKREREQEGGRGRGRERRRRRRDRETERPRERDALSQALRPGRWFCSNGHFLLTVKLQYHCLMMGQLILRFT